MPTPEQLARQNIDALLAQCGWIVQDRAEINLGAARSTASGVAVREFPLKTGFADHLLFVDRRPIGAIEAKAEGIALAGVEPQAEQYGAGLPDNLNAWHRPLPFLYESTGVETFFTNGLDPEPRSRRTFAFHRPETLAQWATDASMLRGRLRTMPPLITTGLWDAQIEAIENLEQSLAQDRPRALIQMATGSGKTFTAVSFIYRLIKFAGARRVLFLVDRSNLGRQTLKEFQQYVTPDDGRKFTELYNVQHLQSNTLDAVSRVCITLRSIVDEIAEKATGTTFSAISGKVLREQEFPLAPLPEQHRIVAKIEELFTRLDAGMAALKRAQANLKRYKAAVLKAACEGRLVPQDASDEPASELLKRILTERRAKWEIDLRAKGKDPKTARYDEPQAPNLDELPELPSGWCWASVEQCASAEPRSIQSGPFGSALHHSEFQDSGILAIGIDNVSEDQFSLGKQHRISPEKFEQLKNSLLVLWTC